jgi:putative transposase
MPRQPRLDAPGLLQHVMARGIERRKIFLDDNDRKSFLERFANILDETQTQCYAWALIPNHFHLLLRTGPTPLSKVMRRLMTGYAVTFNKRHKRAGHLFQNRYKSVICEEDPYLLELIRYIHLNPLRAGLVKDLKELDKYPWIGHSTLLGRAKNPLLPEPSANEYFPLSSGKGEKQQKNLYPVKFMAMKSEAHLTGAVNPVNPVKKVKPLAEKTIEDVLLNFGETKKTARKRYREFVEKGIKQGTREDLQGGGLVRSAGGETAGLLGRKAEEREKGDPRILGSGDFVSRTLHESNKVFETRNKIPLEDLVQRVITDASLKKDALKSSRRSAKITEARAIISFLAVNQLGMTAAEVGRELGMTGMGVWKCADRAEKTLDTQRIIAEYLV